MRTFTRFACFDWSGQNIARPKGIALALADANGPPRLEDRRWSRGDALDWLLQQADKGEPMLIGLDLSPGFPFVDRGAYFPGWDDSPADAKALWRAVDEASAGDRHLASSGFVKHEQAGRHFLHQTGAGEEWAGGGGRLRQCEKAQLPMELSPYSCLRLIGAAQVGKSSLTGMRVLHRLASRIPVWPFDPVPDTGPLIVEVYTSIAARAVGIRKGLSKIRNRDSLELALGKLGSPPPETLARYDIDHHTDALLTVAWLRRHAHDEKLWAPRDREAEAACTEGWTFGVP